MTLTPDQLTAIDRHLRKENWLLNEDLINELTDHYANGVSDRLAEGMTTDAAIREIHQNFGGRKGLLKMEEDYQVSQSRQLNVFMWREIRLFFQQPRLPITIGIFGLLYCLNAFSKAGEVIDSFFSTGMLLMSVSVVGSLLASVVMIVKHRNEVSKAMLMPNSIIFFIIYALGVCQMLTTKFFPNAISLQVSAPFILWGNSLLETLVVIYFIATATGLRRVFRSSVKPT